MKTRSVSEGRSLMPLSLRAHFCREVQSADKLVHFKNGRQFLAILVLAALPLTSTLAQSYSIDWYTVDGGGGTSAGGRYSLSGTIGQPDAGVLTGGSYVLGGGFWGIIQTAGAPLLKVQKSGANVIVSWPNPSTGFKLQQTLALTSPPAAIVWTDVVSPPVVIVGNDKSVTYVSSTGNRFFRLVHP